MHHLHYLTSRCTPTVATLRRVNGKPVRCTKSYDAAAVFPTELHAQQVQMSLFRILLTILVVGLALILPSCSEKSSQNASYRSVVLELSGDGSEVSIVPEGDLGAVNTRAELLNSNGMMIKDGRLLSLMSVNEDGRWGILKPLLGEFQKWSTEHQLSEARLWLDGSATYMDPQVPDISRPIPISEVEAFLKGLQENDNSVFIP